MYRNKSIIILIIFNFIGILFYIVSSKLFNISLHINWSYFILLFLFSIFFSMASYYLNYHRINNKLQSFKAEKLTKKNLYDILFSSSIRFMLWTILSIMVLLPGLHQIVSVIDQQKSLNESHMTDIGSITNTPFDFGFKEVLKKADEYGYEQGAILTLSDHEAELLLYHDKMIAVDDLTAKRIKINDKNQVLHEEDVYFTEDFLGYSLQLIYTNSASMNYLLGYRYKAFSDEKQILSDLLIIDKNSRDLKLNILQSYKQAYDAQSNIPTIIEFTIDMVGDYLVFEDIDSYWKVQDIHTKEIYTSNEYNSNTNEAQQNYMQSGKYIYILKYSKDQAILAFDTITHKFLILNTENKQ